MRSLARTASAPGNVGPAEHPTTRYARAVQSGDVAAGPLVQAACRRHLADLERSDLRFDPAAADRALTFFRFLRHSKGEWAGSTVLLQPWQEFIVGSLFGWRRPDRMRRFRRAYIEVSRKNGKTLLLAGVGLYLAFFDGEPGAEVYAAATKRDQAKICWTDASRMVAASSDLQRRITRLVSNLHSPASSSKFEPLGADADSMDGLNIHGAIVDELHAHKSRAIVDVLETATGARRQPLVAYITTAGYDRNSVCWEYHVHAAAVAEGMVQDDETFSYVACLGPGDSWTDERVWIKANPNLGISVKLEDLRAKCQRAQELPGQQNAFRRLHCNEWTEQSDRWLDLSVWDRGAQAVAVGTGQECFAGLDLASTTDVTALALLFPAADGSYDLQVRYWVPEEGIRARSERDRVPYDVWERAGILTSTPGNVTDYERVRRDIHELAERYRIREIAYDRWNASQLVTQLQGDGLNMIPFGQGFASMASPTRELEKLVLSGKLRHGGDPVLRWMAGNVSVEQDAAGNLKPSKAKSTGRIDGIVAAIMALGRAVACGPNESVYERRGLLVL